MLAIHNSNVGNPLIQGNFSDRTLTINGETSSNTNAPTLYVKGRAIGDDPKGHILHVENTFNAGNEHGVLALSGNNVASNPPFNDNKANFNYITFFFRAEPIGTIEIGGGDTGTNTQDIGGKTVAGGAQMGLRFKGGGADYAEWMYRLDSLEKFTQGQIVGIKDGKISKNTENATDLKVISTSAIVLGNWKGKEDEHKMEQVAFLGQVPVLVHGKVNTGDLIIASGKNDGTGIAVPESEITPEQYKNVVGTAWTSSEDEGSKYILVAVGMKTPEHQISELMTDVKTLKSENQQLKNKLESQTQQMEKLQADFQKLLQVVEQLQTRSTDLSER